MNNENFVKQLEDMIDLRFQILQERFNENHSYVAKNLLPKYKKIVNDIEKTVDTNKKTV